MVADNADSNANANANANVNADVVGSSGWHGMRQSLYCIPVKSQKTVEIFH